MLLAEFLVESPWTNRSKGKAYPLTTVKFEENTLPVVLKSGDVGGRIIKCTITHRGKTTHDYAACHPNDVFKPLFGARLALTRVLKKMNLTREVRTNIWTGFHAYVPDALDMQPPF